MISDEKVHVHVHVQHVHVQHVHVHVHVHDVHVFHMYTLHRFSALRHTKIINDEVHSCHDLDPLPVITDPSRIPLHVLEGLTSSWTVLERQMLEILAFDPPCCAIEVSKVTCIPWSSMIRV